MTTATITIVKPLRTVDFRDITSKIKTRGGTYDQSSQTWTLTYSAPGSPAALLIGRIIGGSEAHSGAVTATIDDDEA